MKHFANGDEVRLTEGILIYFSQMWKLGQKMTVHLVGMWTKEAEPQLSAEMSRSRTPVPILKLCRDPIYHAEGAPTCRALAFSSTGNVEPRFPYQAREQPSHGRSSMSSTVNVTVCVHRVSVPADIASRIGFRFCEHLQHMAAFAIDLLQQSGYCPCVDCIFHVARHSSQITRRNV
jgi:hypothetical protein